MALISFDFEEVGGYCYDPDLDHNFSSIDPNPGESIQPVVKRAFKRIRHCLEQSVSPDFHFGSVRLINQSNNLHIGTCHFYSGKINSDGSEQHVGTLLLVKFYLLSSSPTYRVNLDLEDLVDSALLFDNPYSSGISNEHISKLVQKLDDKFHLGGRIEYMPLIKRGRIDLPQFLRSSDERILEYDFTEVLFHEKTDFQDVKIVKSPSFGNTLLLDDLQNLAESDINYTHALMNKGSVDYRDKEILILGGGDGGLLYELLKEGPKFVTMAEIDSVVIQACRDHLKPCGEILKNMEGLNYKIIVDDCMKVLRNDATAGKKYDIIFNDLTDIPVCKRPESLVAFQSDAVQKDNPWHFIEAIFNLSLARLVDGGLYMTHTTGKGNLGSLKAYEDFLENSQYQLEFSSRSAYVPSFMEMWMFYTVIKKGQLKHEEPQD